MKLLLTSARIKNASIHNALVDLLGKPIAESCALCIPTAIYPFPGGPGMAYRFISGLTANPVCGLGSRTGGHPGRLRVGGDGRAGPALMPMETPDAGLPSLLIEHAVFYTPAGVVQPGWLLAEGGQIRALGEGQPPALEGVRRIDARGYSLLPGFVDLHAHGAMGHEVMDADPDGLRAMARFYARHGVTAFLPTTWTDPRQAIDRALAAVAAAIGPVADGATILGVHLEGPYLNEEKCGAQDVRAIRRAQREEALAWLDTGLVRLIALAPEFEENLWLIAECARRGVTVSAAHTTAGYDAMRRAVALGLRQVTHCFNAMVGLGHRELGTVGAALALPELKCELIADNLHVHPEVMNILMKVKGPEGVILVTDPIRGAGMPVGEYAIDDRTVTIHDGAVRLPDGTLAGSILTMERALANIVAATGRPLADLWHLSSRNAAQAIGATSKGSLEVGKDADLVLLDDDFGVALTVVAGQVVCQR